MKARRLPRGVYRRGDVLWIRLKGADGKLTRETTGQCDVKVAETILAKRRAEAAMLSHFPTRKFEQITFDDLREAWEPAHLKKTPSFRYLLPRVLEAFGGAKARDMTPAKVQEFLDRLREKGRSSTRRSGTADTTRTRSGRSISSGSRRGRDRFLSIEEFRLLMAKCKDPELRTVILVLCMTTLRLRELLNRRWSEVHLDGPAPYVSVPHTKTGVPKKTPLPRVAVEALQALPSYGVNDYVFPSRPTTRWRNPKKAHRWDFGHEFRQLVRSLGIENVRIHDLRHTGPSVLLMQGIPGDVVRKPVFRAQTVDLIAQVLLRDTPTDTVAPGERAKKRTRPQVAVPKGKFGGVDGTRTRDLRRDRPAF